MARIRSPNHPAISLPEAIEKTKIIHSNDRQSPINREVIAQHLGYGGINGLSSRLISALIKYGLLDEVDGDRAKVSALAMRILFPTSDDDKNAAIEDAAFRPPLFAEMREQWPDGVQSDANLRSYLARRNFAEDAIGRVMEAYKATIGLLAPRAPRETLAHNTESEHTHQRSAVGREGRVHQATATLGGTGGLRVDAQVIRAGVSRATLPLAEGVAAVEFPDRLSPESYEDLVDWLDGMRRRAERVMKRTQQEGAATAGDAEEA